MIDIQDLVVTLADGQRFEGEIEDNEPGFSGQWRLPPVEGGGGRTLIRSNIKHRQAVDCYRWMLSEAERYARQMGTSVADVDSPCNAPFVDADAQQQVVASLRLSLQVKVNGVRA